MARNIAEGTDITARYGAIALPLLHMSLGNRVGPVAMALAGGAAADEARRQFEALSRLSRLFADRIRDASLAAGAAAISPALGASPELADVVVDRYQEAGTRAKAAA